MVKADPVMPPGVFINEDPPVHTIHRALVSRAFTPGRMRKLEDQIRAFCAACLDPLVGDDRFDFVLDLGAEMPVKTIGMLIGIPDADQPSVRDPGARELRNKPGEPLQVKKERYFDGGLFADYVAWREKNPSDDLVTELLNVEFDDLTGATRRLTQEELLTFIAVIAGAGVETTGRLFGWMGKVLAEHPDQRRRSPRTARWSRTRSRSCSATSPLGPTSPATSTEDVEYHGQVVPAGSAILLMVAAGNRDERRFDDPDRFDIHRQIGQSPHLRPRRPLLPRRRARPHRRPHRPRRGPQPLPRVGHRPRRTPDGRPPPPCGVGLDAGGRQLICSRRNNSVELSGIEIDSAPAETSSTLAQDNALDRRGRRVRMTRRNPGAGRWRRDVPQPRGRHRDGQLARACARAKVPRLLSRRRRPHLVDADLQPRAERGEILVAHPDADGVIVVLGLILLVCERIGVDRVDPGLTGDDDGPGAVAVGIQIQADPRAGRDVRDLRGVRHRIHRHIVAVEEEPHQPRYRLAGFRHGGQPHVAIRFEPAGNLLRQFGCHDRESSLLP